MRKMQVLSISLIDYTVKESMRKVDEYLRSGKVNTIAYVTKQGILEADQMEQNKEFLQSMDMTVAMDADILRAADIANRNRVREVETNEFMKEFLKKLVRNRKRVYILTDTKEKSDILTAYIKSYEEGIQIAGEYALDDLTADEDFLINEINKSEPNVIISLMPSLQKIEFYNANQMKLNVAIWLMLKEEMPLKRNEKKILRGLSEHFLSSMFQRRVNKYNNDISDENKE